MSFKLPIIAVALLSVAAAAHAAFVSALPEAAMVTLVFIALATIGLLSRRKPAIAVEH